MKDFVTLPLHAEFKGAKAPSAPVKIIPTAQDSTFWLRSGERLSADGSRPCRAARASIGFSVRVYRTSHNCALTGQVIGAVALAGTGAGVQVAPTPVNAAMAECQAQAFVEALKPRRSGKPVVAVLALNEGTETTDFLLPHAVLQRAGVVDLQVVAPRRGRVFLYPALQVEVAQDLASFDRAYPSGADYVIVPAMRDDNNPAIAAWLKQQADRGARIVGVCAGALVVGRAGLLDGRRFTIHWYYRKTLLKRHPGSVFVPHQRYVIDGAVATTTGITASVPTMLALVEAIDGRGKAQALATELGVDSWSPAHDSSLFGLNASRAWSCLLNKAAFWRHERWSAGSPRSRHPTASAKGSFWLTKIADNAEAALSAGATIPPPCGGGRCQDHPDWLDAISRAVGKGCDHRLPRSVPAGGLSPAYLHDA
jgi:putative intracellular protease/amidase